MQSVLDWVRPEIRALKAYHVADAEGMVKLDAMENPFGWSADLQADWKGFLSDAPMNRYPDPEASKVQALLRLTQGITAESGLILGNGSDELIQLIMMAVSGPNRKVMAPVPSFVMYEMIAKFLHMPFIPVPLAADFSLDFEAMLDAIAQEQPAVIFLAYPNNPTGNLFSRAQIEQICAATPGLVVIDEAYTAFAEDSFMADVARYENVLVMRTLSKWGLAGLRLGYMAGNAALIEEINKVRLPYNINILTQLTVEFALTHHQVFDAQAAELKAQRAKLLSALRELSGIQVFESQANFVLVRLAQGQATRVFEALKAQKILIKNLSPAGGLLADCLRITVGSEAEMAQFLAAFKGCLQA
jgi:histidinol-phosphate aminotransferase